MPGRRVEALENTDRRAVVTVQSVFGSDLDEAVAVLHDGFDVVVRKAVVECQVREVAVARLGGKAGRAEQGAQ